MGVRNMDGENQVTEIDPTPAKVAALENRVTSLESRPVVDTKPLEERIKTLEDEVKANAPAKRVDGYK
jgi:hypothetical protein